MHKPIFENDALYHLYNRGVEKRTIYLDRKDYLRFIYNLYEFNDETPAENFYYKRAVFKSHEVEPREDRERKLLVEIVAFCLMPNHFHIFLRQHVDNGIIKFMQKLGTGYTMYFNKKYERVGALFQGRFKAADVTTHKHFLYLPHYIHLNPLAVMPKSTQDRTGSAKQKMNLLESYDWSSYHDFVGREKFTFLLQKNLITELYGSNNEYKQSLFEWINENNALENELKEVVFEE